MSIISKITPSIIFRRGTKNFLYSAIVVGDKDGLKPHIEFSFYERFIKNAQGKFEWVLVPCFEYNHEVFKKEDKSFDILCEFPHFKERKTDKKLEQLGFEIDRLGGNDIYTDSFGEMQAIPTEIRYKKNGVEIRYVYR